MSQDLENLAKNLLDLESEHALLDQRIIYLSAEVHGDQLLIRRLKKRKLNIKDRIEYVRSKMIPDINAWSYFPHKQKQL